MDDIRHERTGHRGAFVWVRDGERLAEMTYTVAGARVIIDHTDVDDRLRGMGAGKKLVQAAVEWAVFDKTPGYSDVLAK